MKTKQKSKRLRSPITWFGGKGNMIAKLLPLLPDHHIYCEAFGGGASLLCAKPPSPVEVYNDLNQGLVNLFRVLRDRQLFSEFERLSQLTLVSREEHRDAIANLNSGPSVERAWRFFTSARQSFAGHQRGSWGYIRRSSNRGMASSCSKWLSTVDLLPELHQRWQRVQVDCDSWDRVLSRYDEVDTLFYLDPPYVSATRKGG